MPDNNILESAYQALTDLTNALKSPKGSPERMAALKRFRTCQMDLTGFLMEADKDGHGPGASMLVVDLPKAFRAMEQRALKGRQIHAVELPVHFDDPLPLPARAIDLTVVPEAMAVVDCLRSLDALVVAGLFGRNERQLAQDMAASDARAAEMAATDSRKVVPNDGPLPPNRFRWKREILDLPPRQWMLLNYLWERDSATFDELVEGVWNREEVAETTIRGAVSRLAAWLLQHGVSLNLTTKQLMVICSRPT